jgi:hypothetical protein
MQDVRKAGEQSSPAFSFFKKETSHAISLLLGPFERR